MDTAQLARSAGPPRLRRGGPALRLLDLLLLAVRGWLAGLRPRRRVPVLLQRSAVECGAASLAMVLSYHGRATRVSECSHACGVARDGLTALDIVKGARAQGLLAKGFSRQPKDFAHLPLPAVVHWNFCHFMVVERWGPEGVEVVDPAVGRRRLTAREFDAGFTGIVLTFERGPEFRPRRPRLGPPWTAHLRPVLRTPGATAVVGRILLASLFLLLVGLVPALMTMVLIDQVLALHLNEAMPALAGGLAIAALAVAIPTYLRANLLVFVEARFGTRLMLGLFEHVLALPARFFQEHTGGDLLMRLGSGAAIRQTLTGHILAAALDGALALGYVAVLAVLQPGFAAVALGLGLLQAALVLTTAPLARRVAQQELSAQAFAQSYFYEVLAGMETLKASGREDWALDKWSNLFYGQLNLSIFRRRLAALTDAALATLRVFAPLALLWFGSLAVLDGTMTLGTMLALTAVATSFLLALASLAGSVQQLQSAAAHLERIDDVMDAAPEQAPQDGGTAPELSGRVELRRVGYRYSTAASWALRDVSVAIEPGQKVAVVGRTGSGKSTLARLLLGLYPPDEGEVLFDGVPLQRLSLRDLRRRFGVVTDEPFLFSGTIRQNIAFNDPGLPDEAVASAARVAQVNDEIRRLPMGYETFVGEGGSALSGGQRQRIAIARAVAHRPPILLLDEATSHLDARTERLVDRELSGLAGTRVVIAHRLSTVRDADLILVMDGGRIVERGTHAALMARGGPYAALVREQQEADRDEPAPAPAARAA